MRKLSIVNQFELGVSLHHPELTTKIPRGTKDGHKALISTVTWNWTDQNAHALKYL